MTEAMMTNKCVCLSLRFHPFQNGLALHFEHEQYQMSHIPTEKPFIYLQHLFKKWSTQDLWVSIALYFGFICILVCLNIWRLETTIICINKISLKFLSFIIVVYISMVQYRYCKRQIVNNKWFWNNSEVARME